jgi:very-short-patch-repair endonuclease
MGERRRDDGGLRGSNGRCEYFGRCLDRCESPIERMFLAALVFFEETTFDPYDKRPIIARDGTGIELGQQVDEGAYRIDFTLAHPAFRKRYAVELDGFAHHGATPAQFERDTARHRTLTEAGWTVVRFTGREIKRDPRDCARKAMALAYGLVQQVPAKPEPTLPVGRDITDVVAAVRATDDFEEQCRLAAHAAELVRARHRVVGPT